MATELRRVQTVIGEIYRPAQQGNDSKHIDRTNNVHYEYAPWAIAFIFVHIGLPFQLIVKQHVVEGEQHHIADCDWWQRYLREGNELIPYKHHPYCQHVHSVQQRQHINYRDDLPGVIVPVVHQAQRCDHMAVNAEHGLLYNAAGTML